MAVAAPQRKFCSCTGTVHFYLRQPRRALRFAHRGWVHFIDVQFSNPASRSAPMPAAFSLAVAPIETAPARGEATEAVLGVPSGRTARFIESQTRGNPARLQQVDRPRQPTSFATAGSPCRQHRAHAASVSHRDLVQDQTSMITVSTATIHHSPIRLDIEATLFHTANKAAAWACARQ